jgi:excinuclease ABC subunit A
MDTGAEPIRIRGARTHNLRDVDLDIPRNQLVVLTGLSGSGKSSLAFDTLLAEGQRQYVESLSIHARQFFDQMERPDVDVIDGLQPTIAIDQCPISHNRRSTVATITEIYDFLRVLMARTAQVNCPGCDTPIAQQTPSEIEQAIRQLPDGTRVMILAPMVRGRTGRHVEVLGRIRQQGFVRVRIDGETYEVEHAPELNGSKRHDIEAVVDRVVIRSEQKGRLAESVRLALTHGEGALRIIYLTPQAKTRNGSNDWCEQVYSTLYACPGCGQSIAEVEPRTFSFNSPYGACHVCDGLGANDGILCHECGGSCLQPVARACRLGGMAIHEITALPIAQAHQFFTALKFEQRLQPIGQPFVEEMVRRLAFLVQVGVDYLSLNRPVNTLSGGETQRVRLATGIGSGLVGVLYILDEPSIGLHPRDSARLIQSFRQLQRQGNTVLIVEHDEAMMRASDWLVELGPGAGERGGAIVAQGPPGEVAAKSDSMTGRYLSGQLQIKPPAQRRQRIKGCTLSLRGAEHNNLQAVDMELPLGLLTCVTGVSGSGKSSLIIDTLALALARQLQGAVAQPGHYGTLHGVDKLDRMIHVDQSPIGRSSRSNPATYTGMFDEVRRIFAGTKHARQAGYRRGRFSFNAKGGRCEHCQGHGVQRIEMRFLSDLFVTCPVCQGRQFNRQTLAVRYRDQSIADVLAMSIDRAAIFFQNHSNLHRMLVSLVEIGLGYLSLGQRSTTLSGGESQRIRLAAELGRPASGHVLYILDEPTTGLHTDDIGRLLAVLQKLVELGNTVLVIEHNLDVINSADWVIDLGPEGGGKGGQIVVAGTPEEVATCAASHTGRFLRDKINRNTQESSSSFSP